MPANISKLFEIRNNFLQFWKLKYELLRIKFKFFTCHSIIPRQSESEIKFHSGNLIKFRGPETPVRCRWRAACSYYFNRKGAPGDGSTGSMRREGAQPGRGGAGYGLLIL